MLVKKNSILDVSNVDVGTDDHFILTLDIYDPINRGILDAKNILIEKASIRKLNLTFYIDRLSTDFSYSYFLRS